MDGDFETLVYTDCRPGQGLRGSAGLQFQARSNDTVAAAETLVKDHLLYEPPSRWMADRRAVADYPPSFAHLSSAGYLATATGVYRGREANGVREGNQLTHAIVTTDPDSYAGLRPAQLFGAAFWSSEPAPTTRSEPVKVSPSGPYTPARAKQFVLDQPDGPGTLRALVSALEKAGDPGGGRVMFVGDDVPAIVEWLVAGTLLVPRARALQLGFKIYSNDPARSSLPIVAVHPDFAGSAARIDNQLGYLVFDLTSNEHSRVVESAAASEWVRLFLTEDPRDAVDALDVAAESKIENDDAAAAALGLAAILHREPTRTEHALAIVGWLRQGPPLLRAAYGADLADIFVENPERWPRTVLRLLDQVGSDGLLQPGEAAEVRVALIIKDIEEAVRGGAVTAERPAALPVAEWGPDREDQVRNLLLEAISEPGTPGLTVEALLRVAHCYRAELTRAELGDAGRELAHALADRPDLMRPGQWPDDAGVDDLLIAELAGRVRRGGAAPALVGDDWRHWLRHRDGLPDELAVATIGALVRHGDDRAALVSRTLGDAAGDPEFYADQAEALFSQCSPTPAEMYQVLKTAPAGTPPIRNIFHSLATTVAGQGPVIEEEIGLCSDLFEKGLLDVSRPLEVVLSKARRLHQVTGELKKGVTDPERVIDLTQEIVTTSERLITAYRNRVVDALVAVPRFAHPGAFFGAHPALLDSYLERLAVTVKAEERPAPAVAAFWLSRGFLAKDSRRGALDKAVDHWLLRVPDKQVAAAGELIEKFFDADWTKSWDKHVESLSGRRRRHRLAHPFGGRS